MAAAGHQPHISAQKCITINTTYSIGGGNSCRAHHPACRTSSKLSAQQVLSVYCTVVLKNVESPSCWCCVAFSGEGSSKIQIKVSSSAHHHPRLPPPLPCPPKGQDPTYLSSVQSARVFPAAVREQYHACRTEHIAQG